MLGGLGPVSCSFLQIFCFKDDRRAGTVVRFDEQSKGRRSYSFFFSLSFSPSVLLRLNSSKYNTHFTFW